ncbi:cold shock domain-containing protein [Methyloglobulus sp.]|uniref:cold shock domain-containing protein n=1 Tax=Methyloglobulus sp. TaxID=2518622 RepID=UPI0032B76D02
MTKPLLTGVLKTWKEDRGFGFITPDNAGRDVFIHISALGETDRRPVPGDIIHYQVARDKQGKFRAINASIAGVNTQHSNANRPNKAKPRLIWAIAAALGLLVIAAAAVYMYFRSRGLV